MSRVTITKLNNMTSGKMSEKVGARGDGSLLFECNPKGVKEIYYRYRNFGKDIRIKIGNHLHNNVGISIQEARSEVIKLANLKIIYPNLKTYLLQNQEEQEKKQVEGTFKELIRTYIEHLYIQKKVSANNVEYHLTFYVIKPFPRIAKKIAKDISIEDVVKILKRMLDKGITTGANRVRSYLHAAFNYVLLGQNDPRQCNHYNKKFSLANNPVKKIPLQKDYERVRDRVLTDDEMLKLWNNIQITPSVGLLTSCAIQFVIACGGQRPQQLMTCKWSDYDLKRCTVTILDLKGNRNRKHVIPLTDLAIDILNQVQEVTKDLPWPFTYTGRAPLSVNAISTAIRSYIKYSHNEHFMLKDIRRTCKRLMIDVMINREVRNLIQGHGLIGVDYKHYDHTNHLPEKIIGMQTFTKHLKKVVDLT